MEGSLAKLVAVVAVSALPLNAVAYTLAHFLSEAPIFNVFVVSGLNAFEVSIHILSTLFSENIIDALAPRLI
jgi:hypothetical protein